LRDLFVFLILFLMGLAIWTTGLFPAVPVQAVPPGVPEIEPSSEGAVDAAGLSAEPVTPANQEQAHAPPLVTGDSPEPASVPEETQDSQPAVKRRPEKGNKSDSWERTQNEQAILRIKIHSLQIDAQVVDVPFDGVTWDISTLGQDIARLGELPGESAGENVVLAGHFSTSLTDLGPFRYISRLAIGEPVLVYTDRMVYTYQVREHAVVEDQDTRVIAYTSEPQLTLLTCETWDEETKRFLRRRVVFADLVKSEPLGIPTIQ
jgi:LPXTG-site transpeptidase (sortase) family protein